MYVTMRPVLVMVHGDPSGAVEVVLRITKPICQGPATANRCLSFLDHLSRITWRIYGAHQLAGHIRRLSTIRCRLSVA
jgi:hypothetical protein